MTTWKNNSLQLIKAVLWTLTNNALFFIYQTSKIPQASNSGENMHLSFSFTLSQRIFDLRPSCAWWLDYSNRAYESQGAHPYIGRVG